MPKNVYKIDRFEGGINDESDAKDLEKNEVVSATDVSVSSVGRVETSKYKQSSVATASSTTQVDGEGLFLFSADRNGGSVGEIDLSGAHTGSNGASVMTDSNASFPVDALIGATINNTTDGCSGTITDNTATTVTVGSLAGGTDNDFDTSDAYTITGFPDTGDDYITVPHVHSTGGVMLYSNADGLGTAKVASFATNTAIEPKYFVADGGLRVCDGNFASTQSGNKNRWYGYIKRDLFSNLDSSQRHSIDGWRHENADIDMPSVSSFLANGAAISTDAVTYTDATDGAVVTQNDTGYTSYSHDVHNNDRTTDKTKANMSWGSNDYVNKVKVILKITGYDAAEDWSVTGAIRVGAQNSNAFQATGYQYFDFQMVQEMDQYDGFPNLTEDYLEYTFTFPDAGLDISSNSLRISIRQLTNDSNGTLSLDSFNVEGGSGVGAVSYSSSPNAVNVTIGDSNTTAADWADDWNVGISFIYDNGQESLVRKIARTDGLDTVTLTKSPYTNVGFNFANTWNQRITGVNIYMKKKTTFEWSLHAICDFVAGTIHRYGDDQKYYCSKSSSGWHFNIMGDVSTELPHVSFESSSLYSQDLDTLSARFKHAVIAKRRLWAANVMIKDKNDNDIIYSDRIVRSPVNKFDILPIENSLEAAINDGESITALTEYGDRLLQFKERTLYIINISGQIEFVEGVYKHMGAPNQRAVCKTDIGVAWVNKNGCFLFDGRQVRNLLEKRGNRVLREATWGAFISTDSMITFEPSLNQIIVVKSYKNTANSGDAYIYDIVTGSWVYKNEFLDSGNAKTNIINDWNGDINYAQQSSANCVIEKIAKTPDVNSSFEIITPDIDFGNPASRKNIYDFHVSYIGGTSQDARLYYRTDGGSWTSELSNELITNGTFDTNTNGWDADATAALSVVSNQLVMTAIAGDPSVPHARAFQSITTEVGKTYRVTGNFIKGTADAGEVHISDDSSFQDNYRAYTASMTSTQAFDFTFKATLTTHYILLHDTSTTQDVNDTTIWDNVSVKLVAQLNSTSTSQTITKFSPQNFVQNAKSVQLKFDGTISSTFSLNDISIVYREKRVI